MYSFQTTCQLTSDDSIVVVVFAVVVTAAVVDAVMVVDVPAVAVDQRLQRSSTGSCFTVAIGAATVAAVERTKQNQPTKKQTNAQTHKQKNEQTNEQTNE